VISEGPVLSALIFVLKLSAWCLIPFAASLLLQRRSAAERHLLLVATLIGTLALPLALTWLPPVGPGWLAVEADASEISSPPSAHTAPHAEPRSTEASLAPFRRPSQSEPESPPPTAADLTEHFESAREPMSNHGAVVASATSTRGEGGAIAALQNTPLWIWVASLWFIGFLIAIGRLVLSFRCLRGVLNRSERIDRRTVTSRLDALRREAGLARTPALLSSPEITVPVAIDPSPYRALPDGERGASFHQAIILPADWEGLSPEALRIALLHELAHLKRGDGWTQLGSSLVAALYWWHPAVLAVAAWARREAERAADDFVLAHGEAPSHYADQLLVFAKNLHQPTLLGVPLMNNRRSDLKQRVIAILDPNRVRNPLSRRVLLGAGALALLLLLPLSGVRLISVSEASLSGEPLGQLGLLPFTRIDAPTSPSSAASHDAVASTSHSNRSEMDRGDERAHEIAQHNAQTYARQAVRQNIRQQTQQTTQQVLQPIAEMIAQHEGHESWDWEHDEDHGHGKKKDTEYSRAYELYNDHRYREAAQGFAAAAAAGEKVATSFYNAACSSALAGDTESALTYLDQAIQAGWDDAHHLVEDSDLDSLRTDARFQATVDRLFEANGETRSPIEGYRLRSIEERYSYLVDANSQDGKDWYRNGTDLLSLRRLGPAQDALNRAVDLLGSRAESALYNLSCLHAVAGDAARANETLKRAIEAGYSDVKHMQSDPDLQSLRSTAGFESAIQLARDLDLSQFRDPDGWNKWTDWAKEAWKGKHKGRDGHSGHLSEYDRGRWSEAVDFYRAWTSENPEIGRGWYNLGWALHHSRRFDEAAEPFERSAAADYSPINSAYNIACGHAMSGSTDEAFRWLDEAVSRGYKNPHHLENDSDLKSLHDDPRFRQLIWKLEDASDDH